jgi:hypothetical protein
MGLHCRRYRDNHSKLRPPLLAPGAEDECPVGLTEMNGIDVIGTSLKKDFPPGT